MKEQANNLGFCTDMKLYKQEPENYVGSTADFATIIRIAITNRKNSPDIYQVMQLLGEDVTKNRFKNVIDNI